MIRPLPQTVAAFIFLSLILSFSSIKSYAADIAGNEITYKQVDSLKYEVDFIMYRDCSGNKLTASFATPKVKCNASSLTRDLTWKIVSITEIKTVCDSLGLQCQPVNSTGAGNGFEKIVFRSTVDFKTSTFDSFVKTGCTKIRFELENCYRNNSIKSFSTFSCFYNFAELSLDIEDGNTSPTFTSPPLFKGCCNQPMRMTVGAVDYAEGDSLSFRLSEALVGPSTSVTYSGNYSYTQPFDAYFPGSLKPPYNNPNANPPIGVFIDESTGELVFTPTSCSEHTAIVIEVLEWRKNSKTGKYEQIGITRRDVEFVTVQCSVNIVPTIVAPTKIEMCEGVEKCIDITVTDIVKVPPPPLPTPSQDSVFLFWNKGIPGATFKVSQDSNLQSAKFCWTPDTGATRGYPYTFVVSAYDNNCIQLGKSQRTFEIKVKPKLPAFSISIDSISCNGYTVNNSLKGSYSNYTSRLSIRPLGGSNGEARFASTNSTVGNSANDTIYFTRNGQYELTYEMECEKPILDTITVTGLAELQMPEDFNLCSDAGRFGLTLLEPKGARGGTWTYPARPTLINSLSEFEVDSLVVLGPMQFVLHYEFVNTNSSCKVLDSIKVSVNPLPIVTLNDKDACQAMGILDAIDDKILIRPGGGTLALGFQKWSCVDCGGFKESDIIKDINAGKPGSPQRFQFHIDTSTINLKGKTLDEIRLELEFRNVFGCVNRDTTTIRLRLSPVINTVRLAEVNSSFEPYAFCEFNDRILLEGNYDSFGVWSSDDTTAISGDTLFPHRAINKNKPFNIYYNTSLNGCAGADTVAIVVHPKHTLEINKDTAFTWYADTMRLNINASYTNSQEVLWLALTGGEIKDPNADSTEFLFTTFKDSLSRLLVYATTIENAGNVCPAVESTMQVFVHPSPCVDITMNYNLTSQELKLEPSSPGMRSYFWEVNGETSMDKTPTFDLTTRKDSLIVVKLTAVNQLGDSCVNKTILNANNGSVDDLVKRITLYPNPVTSFLTVKTDFGLENAVYSIYSNLGSLVKTNKILSNQVDCTDLVPGLYSLVIQIDNQVYRGQFIKY